MGKSLSFLLGLAMSTSSTLTVTNLNQNKNGVSEYMTLAYTSDNSPAYIEPAVARQIIYKMDNICFSPVFNFDELRIEPKKIDCPGIPKTYKI